MSDRNSTVLLDKSRHFGVVFPPEKDAHFHQDGFYFNREGKLAEDMLDADAVFRLKKLNAKASAREAARKAILEALVSEGIAPEEAAKIAEEDTSPEAITDAETDGDEVDILKWARGQRKYLWAQVVKAAKDQYGFGATTKSALITFIVEEKKIIDRSDVRVG